MSTAHIWGYPQWYNNSKIGPVENPSEAVMNIINADPSLVKEIMGVFRVDAIRTAILPVPRGSSLRQNFDDFMEVFQPELDLVRPGDVCIGFGQGYILNKSATLETRFTNRFEDPLIPGCVEKIDENDDLDNVVNGPENAEEIVEKAKADGANIVVSDDSGTFYCDATGYLASKKAPTKFFHFLTFSDKKTAVAMWNAFSEPLKKDGIPSAQDMPYSTPEQNVGIFRSVLKALK